MRALTIGDSGAALRRDYPAPVPGPGESLVRVTTVGICGTDLELVRGYMSFRGAPGHEFVGIVESNDDPMLVRHRVVGEINAACGRCDFCRRDLGRHCASRTVLGIVGRDGAFADYLVLPTRNLLPVADSMPDDLAVFAEPLAAAYEIFEQVELRHTDRILVLGDGRLGALVGLALRAEGFLPVIGGHHQAKLDLLARPELQVELEKTLRPGFDCVIDCTGNPDGFSRAVALVRPRGRIILKSTAAQTVSLNLAPLVINEITVVGSRCGRLGPALAALREGRVDPRSLISARYALDDGIAALAAAADPHNLKVLLQIS
jgi:threonine dehydrogenase-like Zn-dependent dehydrogenase